MCKVTASQIQADGKVIGTAIDELAAALTTTNPGLATELTAAGNALIAATANWKEGDAQAILTDAENAVIVVLNLIPQTSAFAPLVAIVFTALDLLIANSHTQAAQTANAVANAHMMLTQAATQNTDSPWKGKAEINHHWMNPPRKDFEDAWNAAAVPLGVAKITV
jgi:hypothetical protein